MGKVYDKLIERHKKRVSFVVLVSFLLTFIFVRFYVYSAGLGLIDDPYLYIKGYHIHHLNYGICIMAIAGFWALVFQNERDRLKIGAVYGVGLGLTFDEFGMWMRLNDDYWARVSYDAIIIIALFFISFVYFPTFWYRLARRMNGDIKKVWNKKIISN